jgi:hypothetical protein
MPEPVYKFTHRSVYTPGSLDTDSQVEACFGTFGGSVNLEAR